MFDYVLSADGLYLHAKREELEVCFQIAEAEVRGLAECFETFEFKLPKVPVDLVDYMLRTAMSYGANSKETLFWLQYSELNIYNGGWLLHEPAQRRRAASCKPEEGQDEAYQRTVIEIHSHPYRASAQFSPTDNAEERGFRLYGVIGGLPERPEIRLRVGCYGYFWEIPATWALSLPYELADCNPDSPEVDEEEEAP